MQTHIYFDLVTGYVFNETSKIVAFDTMTTDKIPAFTGMTWPLWIPAFAGMTATLAGLSTCFFTHGCNSHNSRWLSFQLC